MDNILKTGISSVLPGYKTRTSLKPRQRNLSANRNLLLGIYSATTALLLLVFAVTPSAAQRPSTSSNPHSKNLAACSSASDCDSSRTFLRCYEKACMCTRINHFDEEINRCLIRVGGVCTVNSGQQFCVKNSQCVPQGKSNSMTGQCKCRRNYRENIDNLCVSGAESSYSYFNRLLLSLPMVVLMVQWIGKIN